MHRNLAIFAFLAVSLGGCGGGGGSSSSSNNAGGTVTISGAATTAAAAAPGFKGAVAHRALGGAPVTLYKITPDGAATQVNIGTVTTDTTGNYSIPNVPVPTAGTGGATDFYYEVRISDGAGADVRAPTAPTADVTVNVNPEANLAARIMSDVAAVPGTSALPTPSASLIENLRKLAEDNAGKLATGGSMSIPAATAGAAASVLASANGLASAGGNAEKMYKAVQLESEAIGLRADTTNTAADAAAYLKRATREGCDQISGGNPLPEAAATAMGQAFLAGTTFTPQQIVAAYNQNKTDGPVDATAKIAQFANILAGVETKIANKTDLSAVEQIGLYTKRDLSGAGFGASTPLKADQAVAFMQSLAYDPAASNSKPCSGTSVDPTGAVKDLTGDAGLAAPKIADIQIYHNQSGSCPNKGHFTAEVDVYAPGTAVNSVTVASTDATALGGDGVVSLARQGNRWVVNDMNDTNCVTWNQQVTYTVTAQLASAQTLTATVTRNHPLVPEATTSVNGQPTVNNVVSVVRVKRPVYTWEAPATKLAQITGAPAGSAVKYTYEFSHTLNLPQGYVGTLSQYAGAPLAQCASVNAQGSLRLYAVSSFMPTVDCDTSACATALSAAAGTNVDPAYVVCRMNIQTFLVDEYDRFLGQAAGHFPMFCVDGDGNGSCP